MNSFQAKIGWKSMRKIEIKIFVSFRFVSFRFIPTQRVIQNFKKIAKKFNI